MKGTPLPIRRLAPFLLVLASCSGGRDNRSITDAAGYFARDEQLVIQKKAYQQLLEECLVERGFEYVPQVANPEVKYRRRQPLDWIFTPPASVISTVGYYITEMHIATQVNATAMNRRMSEHFPDDARRRAYIEALQGSFAGGTPGCNALAQTKLLEQFGGSTFAEESNLAMESQFDDFFNQLAAADWYRNAVELWKGCMTNAGVESPESPYLFRVGISKEVSRRIENLLEVSPGEDAESFRVVLSGVQEFEVTQASIDAKCQASSIDPIRKLILATQDDVFGVLQLE